MNRIFHASIKWYQYIYLVLLGGVTFYFMWVKLIILALIFALIMIFMIERFIHTTYTLTKDGSLIISHGRFSKDKTIPLSLVDKMEKRNSVKVGSFFFTEYILLHLKQDKYVAVWPMKESEFIETVNDRITQLNLK